ncbi:hypothetical protein CLV62_101169 [Dysgonomonas alginatilytica]|uniref:YD repeat-containing protein n=1 Tax=Dysgonomonas alginatilytica TaxID=1605892 RepID=A0A2V3PTG1_9BACT|nr:hypothetical protein [Dysgonomonas alginatilytica]PXV68903.1 hypothetical protein CLV62_101169 [Dysgonomonas alginatilytica]
MKRTIIQLLFTLLFLVGVTSGCDNDKYNNAGGVNGRPSSLKDGNDSRVFFSYSYEERINQIKEEKGSICDFKYENGELSSISVSPADKNVADGHALTEFTREGNKIIIERWAEPSSSIYKQEIELDNDGIPVKITDVGVYSHTGSNGEITKIREGESYAIFTYDLTTKNLLNQTVYNKITSEATASYTYEYDDKYGVVSRLDMPLWFYAFYAYRNKDYRNDYGCIFFNYSNNVIKETVTNITEGTKPSIITYNIQYNNDNFPTLMGNDLYAGIYMSILY